MSAWLRQDTGPKPCVVRSDSWVNPSGWGSVKVESAFGGGAGGAVTAGADLASLRDRAGLTGAKVAGTLGIHRSAWSEIEQGYRRLPERLVPRLAAVLNREEQMTTDARGRGHERPRHAVRATGFIKSGS